MKYDIGDKVRIKSIDWYNENKDKTDDIECSNNIWFYREMSKFCGKVMTISHVGVDYYTMVEDLVGYWTDEMIEGLVEEETKNWADTSIPDGPYTVTYDSPSMNDSMSKNNIHNEIILPKGYIFKDENGNVINATKIVLEKKKKEYPKTYEECCKILGCKPIVGFAGLDDDEENLYGKFIALKRCRDAYWKLYGDEIGLGKPWEPDWANEHQVKYTIYTMGNDVIRHVGNYIHAILAFPTEEMRDAFYENFKEDIEICKELL